MSSDTTPPLPALTTTTRSSGQSTAQCASPGVASELPPEYLLKCEQDARQFSGCWDAGTSGTLAAHVIRLLKERRSLLERLQPKERDMKADIVERLQSPWWPTICHTAIEAAGVIKTLRSNLQAARQMLAVAREELRKADDMYDTMAKELGDGGSRCGHACGADAAGNNKCDSAASCKVRNASRPLEANGGDDQRRIWSSAQEAPDGD